MKTNNTTQAATNFAKGKKVYVPATKQKRVDVKTRIEPTILQRNEFRSWLERKVRRGQITRPITSIHFSHPVHPDYSSFRGMKQNKGAQPKTAEYMLPNHLHLTRGIEDYHLLDRNFSQVGHHLGIFPDGVIVVSRDLNKDPASVFGANEGAISVQCIGNFNIDEMTPEQEATIVEVSAAITDLFHLEPRQAFVKKFYGKSASTSKGTDVPEFSRRPLAGNNSGRNPWASAEGDARKQRRNLDDADVIYHAWYAGGKRVTQEDIEDGKAKLGSEAPGKNFFGGISEDAYRNNLLPRIMAAKDKNRRPASAPPEIDPYLSRERYPVDGAEEYRSPWKREVNRTNLIKRNLIKSGKGSSFRLSGGRVL